MLRAFSEACREDLHRLVTGQLVECSKQGKLSEEVRYGYGRA